eukprot:TRINITY_DN5751_c0_g1_i3.p1 TRINITY_DN5751_c0_g1~~TRINITY_DN5751_c0_g1_i3.p1  ORF type:complete len:372 (-),score=90.10 TRINITY_DN5751_c0_g1_i3:901-2016(-)
MPLWYVECSFRFLESEYHLKAALFLQASRGYCVSEVSVREVLQENGTAALEVDLRASVEGVALLSASAVASVRDVDALQSANRKVQDALKGRFLSEGDKLDSSLEDSLTSDSSEIFKVSSALASFCLSKVIAGSRGIEPFQYIRTLIGEEQKISVEHVPIPVITVSSSPEIVAIPLSKENLKNQVLKLVNASRNAAFEKQSVEDTTQRIQEILSNDESKDSFVFGLVGSPLSDSRTADSDSVQDIKQLIERTPAIQFVVNPFPIGDGDRYSELVQALSSFENVKIVAPFSKVIDEKRCHVVGFDFCEGPCLSSLMEKIRPLPLPLLIDASRCSFGVDIALAVKGKYVMLGSVQTSSSSINRWLDLHDVASR